jgi:hypothetical protein
VYKWQVFLGGIASATFALAGAAGPALAQTVASSPPAQTLASSPQTLASSPLTSLTQALPGLSAVTGEIPGLSSMSSALPDLNSAASQAPAQSRAASIALPSNSTPLSGATVSSLGSNKSSTAAQNTLNGVTGTLPVSSLTGGLPNLGNVTGALSGVTGPQG